jgi:hypothetical protein
VRRVLAGVVAAGVLLVMPAVSARPKGKPAQSPPARAAQSQPARPGPTVKVYRPPDIEVKGRRQVPIKLVFGRQAPTLEARPLERTLTPRIVEAVRRAPF